MLPHNMRWNLRGDAQQRAALLAFIITEADYALLPAAPQEICPTISAGSHGEPSELNTERH